MATPHHHRHLRLAVPSRIATATSGRPYPSFPTPSAFPATPSSASTPSKRRHHNHHQSSSSAATSLLLVLFSLSSVYSLLPFLRSTPPSFSLFPFSFLVALLSLALSFFLPPSSYAGAALSLKALDLQLLRPLVAKSALLTCVFLLRFHSLRYCAAGAAILADLSGALLAKSISGHHHPRHGRRIIGFAALAIAVVLLSYSWDRIGCFPISSSSPPSEGCTRVVPMLLPFVSGFLGFYERTASSWSSLRPLGRKRVRLLSLAFATAILFIPAFFSFFFFAEEDNKASVSVGSLGWPLLNTVVFGVVLSETYSFDEKSLFSAKEFRRDFAVTFFCTLVLELFYFPKLSLPGFSFCGFLLWIAVKELSSSPLGYVELGGADPPESLRSMIMKPIRHILSERRSRKIALFLLINTAYMVVEFVAGFMSNSLGLISDACHMLFDCAALAIGLYASYISKLPANSQFNYGRGRFEVLSGYVNAVFLILVGALIVLESFERILDPQEISTNSLLAVSVGGLLVNVIGLIFFHEEHHHAHGGGSTCSHSYSHSHDHHCHHDHHHTHANQTFVHNSDTCTEEDACGGCQNHGCNHDNDHHQNDERRNDASKCHDHKDYDDHSHSHEDHHGHGQKHVVLLHNPQHAHNYHSHDHDHNDHQRLEVSERISTNQHIEGHNDSHGERELPHISNSLRDAHCLSLQSEESSIKGKQHKHHHIDHNMEGIFLHVLADTMGSIGVVISTLLIKYKGWTVADPACSIFISVMIVSSVMPLLRNSAEILLQRIPRAREHDIKLAVDNVLRIKGVQCIQSMHVWNLTNTDIVGTLHLHVLAEPDKAFAAKSASKLLQEAGVKDLTIQVECLKD